LNSQFPEEPLLGASDVRVINLSYTTIIERKDKVEEIEEISNPQSQQIQHTQSSNLRFTVPGQSQHLQMH
jgi:hypothetical protein